MAIHNNTNQRICQDVAIRLQLFQGNIGIMFQSLNQGKQKGKWS